MSTAAGTAGAVSTAAAAALGRAESALALIDPCNLSAALITFHIVSLGNGAQQFKAVPALGAPIII